MIHCGYHDYLHLALHLLLAAKEAGKGTSGVALVSNKTHMSGSLLNTRRRLQMLNSWQKSQMCGDLDIGLFRKYF
jgi:hypothetical protein